ncbi:MAG: peptidase U32 family protein [Erysipelotrichaceae bacterium]|jgi:putative protease
MKNIEVLSPVGSPESLVAAVRSGADAIYLGAKSFSARRNATNFDEDELLNTVKYCHKRNIKVYVTVNIMIKEKEIAEVIELLEYLNDLGVDAIIVQDLAVARLANEFFPDLPLHGSTQMSVSNPYALPILKRLGIKRVVVAREMNKKQLQHFCSKAREYDIEVEYFVHGALCMSVSGQCLLSAMIGTRSGNRGLCAQSCRLPFEVENGTGYDLSLKDSSLFKYVSELKEIGVSSLKIEGRMKRPEYIAVATKCCREAVDNNFVDENLERQLKDIFSRSGFTDGYYTNKLGKEMFGIRTREDVLASKEVINEIHEIYRNERQWIPLTFHFKARENQDMLLKVSDGESEVIVKAEKPLIATNRPTDETALEAALSKLGGTAYFLEKISFDIDDNLFIRNSEINKMRREAVEKLDALKERNSYRKKEVRYQLNDRLHSLKDIYIRIANKDQLPENLANIKGIIVPINSDIVNIADKIIVEIPRWINNTDYIIDRLNYFKEKNIKKAYCNNLAAIELANQLGFEVMGGNFLNISNSLACSVLEKENLKDITVSAEIDLNEINQIQTEMNKGIIAYGKLPLMLLVNCPLKNGRDCADCDQKGYITDRLGYKFPIRCNLNVSELLNHTPIYLADKMEDLQNLDYLILYFTDETDKQVSQILKAYENRENILKEYTRGLYYRSVL